MGNRLQQYFLHGVFGVLSLTAHLHAEGKTVFCSRAKACSNDSWSPRRRRTIACSISERIPFNVALLTPPFREPIPTRRVSCPEPQRRSVYVCTRSSRCEVEIMRYRITAAQENMQRLHSWFITTANPCGVASFAQAVACFARPSLSPEIPSSDATVPGPE